MKSYRPHASGPSHVSTPSATSAPGTSAGSESHARLAAEMIEIGPFTKLANVDESHGRWNRLGVDHYERCSTIKSILSDTLRIHKGMESTDTSLEDDYAAVGDGRTALLQSPAPLKSRVSSRLSLVEKAIVACRHEVRDEVRAIAKLFAHLVVAVDDTRKARGHKGVVPVADGSLAGRTAAAVALIESNAEWGFLGDAASYVYNTASSSVAKYTAVVATAAAGAVLGCEVGGGTGAVAGLVTTGGVLSAPAAVAGCIGGAVVGGATGALAGAMYADAVEEAAPAIDAYIEDKLERRGGRGQDRTRGKDSLIQSIAEECGVTYGALSEAMHEFKRRTGRGGADNLKKDQIRELAREIGGDC